MKKSKILVSTVGFLGMASFATLAFAENIGDFKALINIIFIDGLIRPLVPLLIGLAVVVFVYGVLLLVLSEGGEKKEEGKAFMFWGIIGIFVMVSVWGLVSVLKDTFRLDNEVHPIEIKVP